MRVLRAVAVLLAMGGVLASGATRREFNVVVYGGTAGGVMAAVSAARQGLKTALVEPTAHVGGMVSGGLGWTDYGRKEVIGGMALEFYWRVGQHYEMGRFGNEVAWLHEPHVAEEIFRQMMRESGVALFPEHRLKESGGVQKRGLVIDTIETENGDRFQAGVFIDSSYEGDLMAQSGVTYTYGREGSAQYGETLAGVRSQTPLHQFLIDVPARLPNGELLPEISANAVAAPGTADKLVQAYNYRMCFSENPATKVEFAKPEHYEARRYQLLARYIAERTKADGKAPELVNFLKVDRIPNGKADVNNNGPISTDYIGGSYRYPVASYQERGEIWRAHREYIAGLLYFLSHDAQVPAVLRDSLNHWGLCGDEFTDNGHWPTQLYIRESRRMVGEYVMVQQDLQTNLTKPDPIGMGSYNSDSHNIQRVADAKGFARNEGDMQVKVEPYQIPYRILLPKRNEVSNLLVSAAFSASHVAYSSVRMEPQYMILGQAAGVAAKLALARKQAVQDVDTARLTAVLRQAGAVMEYRPAMLSGVLPLVRKAMVSPVVVQ